jgi:hypothetical protein
VLQKTLHDGSVVTIAPFEKKHVSRAADLLSVAFSEAINAEVFVRFLRRQIVDYLIGTYKLESCVLLVALLHRRPDHTLAHGGAGAQARWRHASLTPRICTMLQRVM